MSEHCATSSTPPWTVSTLPSTLRNGPGSVVADHGATTTVESANTANDKWSNDSPLSSPDVALDTAQLRGIAENPAWTSYRP
ncbi:MAG: hypothetical protein L0H93_11035 [Nocardioides sp.]|nr:hypothetical protein [Nocardioides sp.]